jgi:uncharacterized protein involved in exopolysaccharide biosynthesis
MLQKLSFQPHAQAEADRDQSEFELHQEEGDRSHLLRPAYYWELVKRRWVFFVIPFVPVLLIGLAVAAFWPATYLSEGKILVQSQQIPTELVRPTVTNAAQERIQVIEQRTMTRENLIAIIDKFQLFPDKRALMSATELVEAMKKSTKIEPVAQPLAFAKVRTENPTIVFTVGFEYSDPQTASGVANELITRILSEDLRDRTNRATDTTKFLAREVQRLQADNAVVEAKLVQARNSQPKASPGESEPATQLAQLKAELVQKSALYSDRHPMIQTLKRQIDALQNSLTAPRPVGPEGTIEALETQQANIQKNLEVASTKLAAARLGENLEKDQQSEKLEVIEQPAVPQTPIKPNRPKIAGLAVVLAMAAGVGLAFLVELADGGIRRSSAIFGVVDSRLVVAIPYITTISELQWRKRRIALAVMVSVAVLIALLLAAYLFMPPLDLIIAKARVGLYR